MSSKPAWSTSKFQHSHCYVERPCVLEKGRERKVGFKVGSFEYTVAYVQIQHCLLLVSQEDGELSKGVCFKQNFQKITFY